MRKKIIFRHAHRNKPFKNGRQSTRRNCRSIDVRAMIPFVYCCRCCCFEVDKKNFIAFFRSITFISFQMHSNHFRSFVYTIFNSTFWAREREKRVCKRRLIRKKMQRRTKFQFWLSSLILIVLITFFLFCFNIFASCFIYIYTTKCLVPYKYLSSTT